jgi:hypothetical protein
MTDAFATLNGQGLQAVQLHVAARGPWYADCELQQDPPLSGKVTLKLGTLSCVGTIMPEASGTFGLQRMCRVVAGGGGWGKELGAKNYHNDAGVKASAVAQDAARETGEQLGGFLPAAERVGNDYVREKGAASRVLEEAAGKGVGWWVDFAGLTQVGSRGSLSPAKGSYQVLAYDPLQRLVTLAVDDAAAIDIGSVLTDERLQGPQTVHEYEVRIDKGGPLRVLAWTGGDGSEGRLASLLRSIVERATDGKLFGKYRYRVVRMVADRVELQAVRRGAGLPDVLPVSMWPGVAGAHAELAPGAEVLVEFVEGDRTQPIITHFAGKGGPGFVPVSLALCGGKQAVARQGDLVQSGGVGAAIILTPVSGPSPPAILPGVPYLVSFSVDPAAVGPLAAPLYGAISTGSPKVRA